MTWQKLFCGIISLVILGFFSGCGSGGKAKDQEQVIQNETQAESMAVEIDQEIDSTTITIEDFKASGITSYDDSGLPEDSDAGFYNSRAISFFESVKQNPYDYDNFMASPISYFGIMGMLCHGAAGTTADDLSEVYPYIDIQSVPDALSMTHRFWGQSGYLFSKDYLALMNSVYEPVLCGVNFLNNLNAADTRIKADMNEMDPLMDLGDATTAETMQSTRIVMGNYSRVSDFSGILQDVEGFEGVFETFQGGLYRSKHLKIHGQFGMFDSDEMTVIQGEDPDSGLAMAFVFPKSETFIPGPELFSVPLEITEISFAIPEFSIHTEYDATPFLGLDEESSDFSRINGLGYLFVGSVLTESMISVDENGINVSGMSSAVMDATDDEPFSLWADDGNGGGEYFDGLTITVATAEPTPPILCAAPDSRPFFFYIMDAQDKSIFYAGYVNCPNDDFIGNRSSAYGCDSSLGLDYLFGKSMIFVADRRVGPPTPEYHINLESLVIECPVLETTEEDYTILDEPMLYSVDFGTSVDYLTCQIVFESGSTKGYVMDYGSDYIIYKSYYHTSSGYEWELTVRLEGEIPHGELSFYDDVNGNCLLKRERGLLLPSGSAE